MKLFLYYVSLFILTSQAISAQIIKDSLFIYSLDSVIVSTSRYSIPINSAPFSIISVDKKKINNIINPLSLEELLSSQPGVFIFNRNNLSQGDKITIRGIGTRAQFGVRGIKIFLDGIPMTFPDGQAQLNNIDVQKIESAEILLGPSSVIYGNSLGGAILLRSKSNKEKVINIQPTLTLASFGQKKYSISSSYNFQGNNISLGGYLTESDGFRDHSDAKFYGLNLVSNFRLSQNLGISFVSNYYNAPYLLNPGTLNKADSKTNPKSVRNSVLSFASAKRVDQVQSGVNINYAFPYNSKLRTTFYLVSRNLDNSIPGRIIDLNKSLGGLRIEYEGIIKIFKEEINFITGVDYEFQSDERIEFINGGIDDPSKLNPERIFDQINYSDLLVDQNEQVRSLGLFSHINLNLTEKLMLFSGIRYDDFRFTFENNLIEGNISNPDKIAMDNFSLMTGFNLKLINQMTIYGNYSTGFQTPTANEFSNNPLSEGGFNSLLKPEFVKNYEFGSKGWIEKLNLLYSITTYYMNFSDLLISYQSEDEETFFRNAGEAENFGIEASLEYYPIRDIKISASYNYMNFKFKDYSLIRDFGEGIKDYQLKRNFVPGIPKNFFSTNFQYNFTDYLFSRIDVNFSDKYYTNDFNGPIPNSNDERDNYINESYTKIDLSSVYKFELTQFIVAIRLKVENIFNERFNQSIVPNAFGNNFFEPAPGRTFYISISGNI